MKLANPLVEELCNSTMTTALRQGILGLETSAFVYSTNYAEYQSKIANGVAEVRSEIPKSNVRHRISEKCGIATSLTISPAILVQGMWSGFADEIGKVLTQAGLALIPPGVALAPAPNAMAHSWPQYTKDTTDGKAPEPGGESDDRGRTGGKPKLGVRASKRAISKDKYEEGKSGSSGGAQKSLASALPDVRVQKDAHRALNDMLDIETPSRDMGVHATDDPSPGNSTEPPHMLPSPAAIPEAPSPFAPAQPAEPRPGDCEYHATPHPLRNYESTMVADSHAQLTIDAILAGWSHEEDSMLSQWQPPPPGGTIFDGSDDEVCDRLLGTFY